MAIPIILILCLIKMKCQGTAGNWVSTSTVYKVKFEKTTPQELLGLQGSKRILSEIQFL